MTNNIQNQILSDLDKLDNVNLIASVNKLNSYENIMHFSKKGVNMKTVLALCVRKLLDKKLKIPSHGYYDLIKIGEEFEKSKNT